MRVPESPGARHEVPALATDAVSVVLIPLQMVSLVLMESVAKDCTFNINEHACPPIFKANVAVPTALGVPEIVNDKVPAPLANRPWGRLAVRPVTPVEVILCVG